MESSDKQNSSDQDLSEKQKLIDEVTEKLQQLQDEYELDLKRYYSLKADEIVLNLQYESWKELYLKQEAEMKAKQEATRAVRTKFWDDREAFCAISSGFASEFAMEATLTKMSRAESQEDEHPAMVPASVMSPLTVRQVDLEREGNELKLKEAELDEMDVELAPEEEMILRLQTAVHNSASCADELEQQIKDLEEKYELDESVRSILKRPSFVKNENDKKQVHFG
ncbi:uncharacterized protein LOC119765220 [Culex quinquefasciatus]|uniref:uncharacterized protein LOC119765220 n=1 Tax=Culex quinquefasciatus TaxID=7176 RepID=UPI0018E2E5AD|nr:uncharacterized protein LOC119765220 [Culex quinquefasciatus]